MNGLPGTPLAGLTADSRKVLPGYLFAALPGSKHDGRQFIRAAVAAGAVAVLAPEDTDPSLIPEGVTLVTDANPRRRLARMAAAFYQAQPGTIAAVTGTNGKTSVASFTRQIWTALGHDAASMGTLGIVAPGMSAGPSLTTPDPVALHASLAELAERRIDHLAMEASSHGLEQFRLDGVRFTAAGFTNLTRDHLDYHGSMQAYLDAKLRLFNELLSSGGVAVVNADDPEFATIRDRVERRKLAMLSYGFGPSDLRCTKAATEAGGFQLQIDAMGTVFTVDFALPGRFQIANALCATGLAIACGASASHVVPLLSRLEGVPGRLQRAAILENEATVYVDYAHTPDALNAVLDAMRPHVTGRLHLVFGCGGDRDKGKRAQMGAIAAELADKIIVTDDNPRTEDPAAIRAQIMSSCRRAREIGNRAEAIAAAIERLEHGDVLIVAGKGHEQGQIVGDEVIPFDDSEVVRTVASGATGGTA